MLVVRIIVKGGEVTVWMTFTYLNVDFSVIPLMPK